MKLKNKKKILITGGSGYIGSCFSEFVANKYKIYTLDKKPRNIFVNRKKIIHIKCDLCNYKKLKAKLMKIKPNIIIHLAAQSTIDFIKIDRDLYLKNNIEATKNIVKISKLINLEKFIFSSTASVYNYQHKELSENDKLKPNNLYGKTKRENEKYILENFKNTNIKFCILRFFNVCSSLKNHIGEFHNPETHLIPKVVNSLMDNKAIKIYGSKFKTADGTCLRDFIHIKDILNGISFTIKFLDRKNFGIFNLGSGTGISVKQVIKKCSNILNKKPIINIKKNREGDVPRLVCNISKAKKEIKWKPKYSKISLIIKDEIKWQSYLRRKKLHRSFYEKN